MVKVGDSIPNIDLVEGKPDAKVNLSKELGSGLIIGVPAAFSTWDLSALQNLFLECPGYQTHTLGLLPASQNRTDYMKAQHAQTPTSRVISFTQSSSLQEKSSSFQ